MSLSKCIGCAHYKRTPLAVVNGFANGFETDCALGREEFFNINGCDQYRMRIEYIPKNAIPYKEIKVTERCHNDVWDETILVAYKEDIDLFPAADVERVRHGRWIWDENGMDWNLGAWRCSECKAMSPMWWNTDKSSPMNKSGHYYCPNCGALMDAQKEAEGEA